MIHFLSTVLEVVYLVSWTILGAMVLRYQAQAYMWMVRNRIAIRFDLSFKTLMCGAALSALAIVLLFGMRWAGWDHAVVFAEMASPVMILAMLLMDANMPAFRLYDCWEAEYTASLPVPK